jgi:hypothetical protein
MKRKLLSSALALLAFSCAEQEMKETTALQQHQKQPEVKIPDIFSGGKHFGGGRVKDEVLATLNSSLFANSSYKVAEIHVCMTADAARAVETIDRQFQSTLPQRWVANDPRRNWNGDNDLNDLDWLAFPPFAFANTASGPLNVTPIYQAMYNKWEGDGTCKTLDIDETAYDFSMGNPSLILSIGGLPPASAPLADVSLIGFLPSSIFNALFGSPNVLGVAFSFVFIDPATGQPSSTTRGKDDKAYSEVWFNNGFTWNMGPAPGRIDLESVILHEFGHTLNLGHFGILQSVTKNGQTNYVYNPVNTMNAFYIGQSRNFLGPNDKGNYCEAWGSWPWN